ncbi:hypothetical protein M0802_007133 [Mischocyttarus mexicanus]|nr:hypothetical protein M0802_007133 [Mischocyttarus mexicanus]
MVPQVVMGRTKIKDFVSAYGPREWLGQSKLKGVMQFMVIADSLWITYAPQRHKVLFFVVASDKVHA